MAETVNGHHRVVHAGVRGEWCEQCLVQWPCSAARDEPEEPADGRSCDCGNCDAESIGWRWFHDLKEWLPACERHLADKRLNAENKRYDADLATQQSAPPTRR